ncbi:MAG TPA: preprotein translocase subunit YajC [Candidatus Angelobacter sp.]|nr:preprotein translocase subunit YajC [Candidatus Angelobacter sp.]
MTTIAISSWLFQAGGSPLGGIGMMLPLLFIFVIFYFLLILPQQRRQKKWQAMINDLKTGDRITTQGGIRGSIISIKDDAVHLRVPPDNLRLEVAKSAVVSVAREDEPKKS